MFFFHAGKSADTGADDHAHTVRIFLLHLKTGVFHGLRGRHDRVLGKGFHTLCGLEIHPLLRNKTFDLRSDLYFIVCGIKLGDRSDTYLFFFNAVPELFHRIADRCDGAQSGNDNSSLLHMQKSLLST